MIQSTNQNSKWLHVAGVKGGNTWLSASWLVLFSSDWFRKWRGNAKTNAVRYKDYYYSFKIFPRFWLVKTTRIIHHNQLLFTKFGKNLRHIESMTSKPTENYWTDDVKMTSKVQPAADWTVDRENLRMSIVLFLRAKWRNSFKNGQIFWMNSSYPTQPHSIIAKYFKTIRLCSSLSQISGIVDSGNRRVNSGDF